ncbi:hypothetical protein D1872_325390 [compost metagenome]
MLERQSDEERILVLFNRSEETAMFELEAGEREWNDLLESDHRIALEGGTLAVELPAYGYAVLGTTPLKPE